MSIQVVVQTQRIEVSSGTPRIVFDPSTEAVTVNADPTSIAVVNAGPPGPPGAVGVINLAEIDSRIATHNQATPVHPGATSGRDFVVLF